MRQHDRGATGARLRHEIRYEGRGRHHCPSREDLQRNGGICQQRREVHPQDGRAEEVPYAGQNGDSFVPPTAWILQRQETIRNYSYPVCSGRYQGLPPQTSHHVKVLGGRGCKDSLRDIKTCEYRSSLYNGDEARPGALLRDRSRERGWCRALQVCPPPVQHAHLEVRHHESQHPQEPPRPANGQQVPVRGRVPRGSKRAGPRNQRLEEGCRMGSVLHALRTARAVLL
mmetsp:Transcript_21119/g.40940  ORF Transcript_21119/g.40940 Transcript_21119/m.40940 type:complete len:228 (-) Transcript_21119:2286-2969(-)